jgi:3-deoxy-D-manno-octulosonic-acid transferase
VINGYDIAYGVGLSLSTPFWLSLPRARRKVLKALRERMSSPAPTESAAPAILIHAVSLGEINATRAMLRALAERRPDLRFVVSTTTDTGYQRGQELYGKDPRIALVRFPLDFSSAVTGLLDAQRPELIALMELEVWPNFVLQCERRGIPVVLVNGRLTAGSYRNYRLGGALVRRMFRRLAAVCAQEQAYADRFIRLGAPPDCVTVTGTMKFDTAQIADRIEGAETLADEVGLHPGQEPTWVCGSTGPGEEELILDVYRQSLGTFPNLRLVIVPRKPERFDEVADLIRGKAFELVRRSRSQISNLKSQIPNAASSIANQKSPIANLLPPVVLGDTMGELRKFYSLADVVFVGRTLVDLGSRQHGSDMIEPAALAKPTIVGHYTGNFAEVMNQFRAAEAMREISSTEQLKSAIEWMLGDPIASIAMGLRAQAVVRSHQGATARNVDVILRHLAQAKGGAPQ